MGVLFLIACLVVTSAGSPPTLVRQPPSGDHPFLVARPFTLECEATGDPQPTYNWTKDGEPLDYSSGRIVQLSGSLQLSSAHASDAGLYQCSAHNALGTALSNVVRLKVEEGSFCGNSLVEEGEECDGGDACCDTQCRLKPGAVCSDKNSPCCRGCQLAEPGLKCREFRQMDCKREAFCTGLSPECPSSIPSIDGSRCLDGGRCYAGECFPRCELYPLYPCDEVPSEAPKNLHLLFFQDARTAKLSWDPVSPESVRGQLRGYKIRTWPEQENEEKYREQVVSGATEALVGLLRPYARNLVKVLAFNEHGDGPPSHLLELLTLQDTPGPVSAVDAIPFGSTALYLTWKSPEETNGVLTGYVIYHKEASGEEEREKRSFVEHFPETRTLLTGLRPNTTYRVTVCATTNVGIGDGTHVEATTLDRAQVRKSYAALGKLLTSMMDD